MLLSRDFFFNVNLPAVVVACALRSRTRSR